MAMSPNFETLELVRTLVASGMPPAQAEAMAHALAKSIKTAPDETAVTKSDIHALAGDMQAISGEIKTELRAMRDEIQEQVQGEIRFLLTWLMFGLALVALIVILTRVIG